ncbi:MAG: lipoyl synthase [Pseudomonadota bacterium]
MSTSQDRSPRRPRLPDWLREHKLNPGAGRAVRRMLRAAQVHTVCEEARCPNLGQCFERGTATFMILGDRCTRGCRFCNVQRGLAEAPDPDEPARVARAALALGLRHVVVTSVTRDDLEDGGADSFARVLHALREALPQASLEVLVPDFRGDLDAVATVLHARPDVFNHNVETVPRLYPRVRPGADYARSLAVLAHGQSVQGLLVKSGLMVGLGETDEEIASVLGDLAAVGVQVVTIGQYLQPRLDALPVERYVAPEHFEHYRELGRRAGLLEVFAGPFIRSSYLADELRQRAREPQPGAQHDEA